MIQNVRLADFSAIEESDLVDMLSRLVLRNSIQALGLGTHESRTLRILV